MAFLSVNLPEPGFRFFAAPGWFAQAVSDPVTPSGTKPLYEVEPPPPFEEATATDYGWRLRNLSVPTSR